MVQLTDYSNLRPENPIETIDIPLNGEVYRAYSSVPANTHLAAVGTVSETSEIAAELAQAQAALGDEDALQKLVEANPLLGIKLATFGMSATERAIVFLQSVLVTEDAFRWAANMSPPDPESSPEDQAAHLKRMITMPQVMAVHKALMEKYAGGRPTGPSFSSVNEDDGSGPTSTAGVPVEAVSTP